MRVRNLTSLSVLVGSWSAAHRFIPRRTSSRGPLGSWRGKETVNQAHPIELRGSFLGIAVGEYQHTVTRTAGLVGPGHGGG